MELPSLLVRQLINKVCSHLSVTHGYTILQVLNLAVSSSQQQVLQLKKHEGSNNNPKVKRWQWAPYIMLSHSFLKV